MMGTLLVVLGVAVLVHGPTPRRPIVLLRAYSTLALILGIGQLRYLKYFDRGMNALLLPITVGLIVLLWVIIPRHLPPNGGGG
jgi:hypothetical protein